jgi:predicted nucleic acid-binding Zn ribbon protein
LPDDEKELYSVPASDITRRIGVSLVYCVRCGAKNPDDATVCAQCGKPLMGVERGRTRHEEQMCFGMPHHWGSILVGLFIIVLGLLILFHSWLAIQDFWPLVLIFIGIAVLVGGLYRYSRR